MARGRRYIGGPRYRPASEGMSPRELKSWLKTYASPRTYCPAGMDNHTLGAAEPWIWVLAEYRCYFICSNCATNCRNVIGPEEVAETLASRQWNADGGALTLAEGQDKLVNDEDLLLRWAGEVRERLKHCHCGCGSTEGLTVLEIAVRESRWLIAVCDEWFRRAINEPIDLRGAGVIKKVTELLSGDVHVSLQLPETP